MTHLSMPSATASTSLKTLNQDATRPDEWCCCNSLKVDEQVTDDNYILSGREVLDLANY
jgi:hypothetical protein